MPSIEYAKYRSVPKSSIWILFWFFIWFALANIVVFLLFKSNYFERTKFDRLLMHPSDNELKSVIYHLKNEKDKTNIVLLGDSVIWGVGSNYSESVAPVLAEKYAENPQIQVVNLAVPGNSFFDMSRTIEEIDNLNNIYLFFINPIRFNEKISNRNFEEAIRFPKLLERATDKDRREMKQCCNLVVPEKENILIRNLEEIFIKLIPIYFYRDSLTKMIIGLQPYAASDAVLSRLRKIKFGKTEDEKKPEEKNNVRFTEEKNVFFEDTNMYNYLVTVTKWLEGKNNVYYIIQDNNLYKRDSVYKKNIEDLLKLFPKEMTLNMNNKIDRNYFIDRSHMTDDGHEILANSIFSYLKQNNAP